jgi:hypothetical protein
MKILSMSVWGDNPRYIVGAQRQIELAKEFYPDFTVRLYTDNVSNYKKQSGVEIIDRSGYSNGVFWRFEPLFESEDNIVIVRDSDGRITLREYMAVTEWLDSSKTFHTFRDHEAHFEFPIIACAFGYKGKLEDKIYNAMKEFILKPFFYTNDQIFLRDFVFPVVRYNSIIHTMNDGWFKDTRSKLKNKYDFCGNGYDEHDMPLYPSTLAECANFNNKLLDFSCKFSKGVF